MLSHMLFGESQKNYKVALLVKDDALRNEPVKQHYIDPLLNRGFLLEDIIAFNLVYDDKKKVTVATIRKHLDTLHMIIERLGIKHILIADAAYFKVLCKVKKAEPYYGYTLDSIWPGVQASLTLNYMQLFHNPSLQSRLALGLDAVTNAVQGKVELFQDNILQNITYPDSLQEITNALQDLHQYPKLTCDVETMGLHLSQSRIVSIAFGSDVANGCSFTVALNPQEKKIKTLLRDFFKTYQGTLIFHNATFDCRSLIFNLFMRNRSDMKGMLEGLHKLFNKIEDTKLLAYLATNSTAGNRNDLKSLAFEFTGNYALEEIKDPMSAELRSLLEYNATDILATWYVYNKYKSVVEAEQKEVYENLFIPSLKVITQMELTGMPLNRKQVTKSKQHLQEIVAKLNNKIEAHPIIQQFTKELRISKAIEATAKLKVKVKTAEDFKDETFNPNSTKQLRHLLYEHLGLPVLNYTDTHLASTDGETIKSLIAHLKTTYNI